MNKQKNNASHFTAAIILIVDDEQLQRDILKIILSEEGYETHVAASAEEALIVTQTLKPDVVLTDLRMCKMDGIELMENLRSQANGPEVIIMSAFGTPGIIEESLEKGAFSFMKKPLNIPQVLFTVRRAFEMAAKVKYPDQRF